VSLPPRALWHDEPPPAGPGSWSTLADDLLEGLSRHELPPVVAIGHSFGAVTALLAAGREPPRFRGLALLDPTIFPPKLMEEIRERRRRGDTDARGLVKGALTRRDRFGSIQEAFAYWRGKPLFHDWSDDALRRYAKAMLRPDAAGFTLAWPPAWEAHYYESVYTETWEELTKLPQGLPILVLRGEQSDTFLPDAARRFGELVPWAEQRALSGRGHLFPQAAPGETGRLLSEWLTGSAFSARPEA